MPLPGGAAEKFGNRYEGRWTVACLLDVMDEKADSIRLEPPEPEGQGFEFWTTKQGVREYHQVKRQHSIGHWTLRTLIGDGVLTNFTAKLQAPEVHCVFVSANSAGQLDELSDRARRSASWEEFDAAFLNADQRMEGLLSCSTFPPRLAGARDIRTTKARPHKNDRRVLPPHYD